MSDVCLYFRGLSLPPPFIGFAPRVAPRPSDPHKGEGDPCIANLLLNFVPGIEFEE